MTDKEMALEACDGALKQDVAKAVAAYADSVVIGGVSPVTAAERFKAGLKARMAAHIASRDLVEEVFSETQPPT